MATKGGVTYSSILYCVLWESNESLATTQLPVCAEYLKDDNVTHNNHRDLKKKKTFLLFINLIQTFEGSASVWSSLKHLEVSHSWPPETKVASWTLPPYLSLSHRTSVSHSLQMFAKRERLGWLLMVSLEQAQCSQDEYPQQGVVSQKVWPPSKRDQASASWVLLRTLLSCTALWQCVHQQFALATQVNLRKTFLGKEVV